MGLCCGIGVVFERGGGFGAWWETRTGSWIKNFREVSFSAGLS